MKQKILMRAVIGGIYSLSFSALFLCASAELKSPINLSDKVKVQLHYTQPFMGSVNVICEELPEQGLSKEYMVEIVPTPVVPTDEAAITNNYILVDDTKYHLRQFHFHMPSEHMINDTRAEAEVHFVHTDATGTKTVVVGAFITCGTEMNKAYQMIVQTLPTLLKSLPESHGEGEKVLLKNLVDVRKLLPLSSSTYAFRYRGSKTSGNLASGVEWIILTTPIEFSSEQLEILEPIRSIGTKIHPRNNRNVSIEHIVIS